MGDINDVIFRLRTIDTMAEQDTIIHRVSGTVKILVTLAYIIKILSMKHFNLISVAIILLYVATISYFGKVSIKPILKRSLFTLPLIIGLVVVNLLYNFTLNQIMLSILLGFKCIFTVVGALLLISVTGIDNLGQSLIKLKVPKVLVSQILLTYRYITVLLEEGYRLKCAYEIRSGRQKISIKVWAQIIGQMLLRSIDRAESVYKAMKLRGFNGEYHTSTLECNKVNDILFLIIWVALFILF